MTSCFVLGDDALIDHTVDHRYRVLVGSRRGRFVTGITGNDNALDLGTHHRTQAHIVFAGFLRLTGAFSGLFNVCHLVFRVLLSESRVLFVPGAGLSMNTDRVAEINRVYGLND